MTAIETYQAVILRGGHVIPRGGAVVIKAPPGADLADLMAELHEHRAELADVARRERSEFAADWRRDVADKKAGRGPGIERWTPATWAVWARTMLSLRAAEELQESEVEGEMVWLRELAGNVVREAVAS